MVKYLVMMPNSWGTGATLSEAEKRARSEGNHGRKSVKKLAWKYDTDKTPEVFIDEMGNLCWKGDKPERIDL